MTDLNKLTEFKSCVPKQDFIAQIFNFDVQTLEQTDDVFISKCVIGLAQYLIYFKSTVNIAQAELTSQKRLLEASIFTLTTADIIKKHKTKKDARMWMINNLGPLTEINLNIEALQNELYLLDGLDKSFSELIAAFKRELTRRENELYQGRR